MWSQYKELCRHKLKVEASHGYCLLDLKMTVENYAWLYNLTVSVLKRQKQEDQSSRSCSDTFWSLKPAWATKVHVWDVWGKAWQSCKMVKSISLSWNFDFLPFCVPNVCDPRWTIYHIMVPLSFRWNWACLRRRWSKWPAGSWGLFDNTRSHGDAFLLSCWPTGSWLERTYSTQEQTGARGLNELLSHIVQRWGSDPRALGFPQAMLWESIAGLEFPSLTFIVPW